MDRSDALQLLKADKAVLAERFGGARLALFGSMARGTAGPRSEVDVLVAFDGPATSARYFGVQFYLEDLLGRSVDPVTEKALRERLRPYVERDASRPVLLGDQRHSKPSWTRLPTGCEQPQDASHAAVKFSLVCHSGEH